ncbi:YczE/YyaS/YitT family protein [Agrococcus sediminis]|uniref:membrane protein YczE n=1 Tax=Agrococcus sediminis TaxID=2599924 RepID=UPI00343E71EC
MHRIRRLLLPIDSLGPADTAARVGQLLGGLVLYGLSLAMLIRADLGVGPWDVFSLGIANHLPMSYGTATVVVSGIVLLLWIPLRQRVGIGTLLNALLVGPAADIGLWLLPEVDALWQQILLLAGGMVLLAFATGFYIAAHLGPGPRDGLMTGLVRITGWRVWIVRTLIEGTVLLIGWLLGGPVGVGTVVFAFGIGPLIGLFLPLLERRRTRRASRLRAARLAASTAR